MKARWLDLEPKDQGAFRAAVQFLDLRMGEPETFEWALSKATHDKVARAAILHCLDTAKGRALGEPWQTAWRFIEEFWEDLPTDRIDGTGEYDIRRRLASGDHTGSLIRDLVALVAPRLKIEARSSRYAEKRKKTPKEAADLFDMRLTSGKAVDLSVLKLDEESDKDFLAALARALEAAISAGLDVAKRLKWEANHDFWRLGDLYRVYFVPPGERGGHRNEPDEFHKGIAPAVKLLFTVAARISELDLDGAKEFSRRWRSSSSPVFIRLWAAFARDAQLIASDDVSDFLLQLEDYPFWLVHAFPEVAELRARRFESLNPADRAKILARIRGLPPRSIWSSRIKGASLTHERHRTALQELARIEAAGGGLDEATYQWLRKKSKNMPRAPQQMIRVEEDFPSSAEAEFVPPDPDPAFDSLAGDAMLRALDIALTSPRVSWDADPATRAHDWLQKPGSVSRLLSNLEQSKSSSARAAALWERFTWAHTPQSSGATDLDMEAQRVLRLISDLPREILMSSINGISHWLSSWGVQVAKSSLGFAVWNRVWPIAATATNEREPRSDQADLSTAGRSNSGDAPLDLDTLNTPAGKLVAVFLNACPSLLAVKRPFREGTRVRAMRDAIEAASGRSHVIALYRMIEDLDYFLNASASWTKKNLIRPLLGNNDDALVLWRAVARRPRTRKVLKEIGGQMLEKVLNASLNRETRETLASNLIVDTLRAFLEERESAAPLNEMQRMLRLMDDEVRANVAGVVARFVREASAKRASGHTTEYVFHKAAIPFLTRVWPQETSLSTPGASRALARLPASSGEAFSEAVSAIERFLVPFDAWSLVDYGLYGEFEGIPRLQMINDRKKAEALLRLLDKTIGSVEGSIVPHELDVALARIREVAPELSGSSSHLRLAALGRR